MTAKLRRHDRMGQSFVWQPATQLRFAIAHTDVQPQRRTCLEKASQ
jgi:hypothetical protein